MLLTVHYCHSVISKFEAGREPHRLYGDRGDSYICLSLSDVLSAKSWTGWGKAREPAFCGALCGVIKLAKFELVWTLGFNWAWKIISCILNFTQRWAFALSNDRISFALCLPNISKESSYFWLLLFRNTCSASSIVSSSFDCLNFLGSGLFVDAE